MCNVITTILMLPEICYSAEPKFLTSFKSCIWYIKCLVLLFKKYIYGESSISNFKLTNIQSVHLSREVHPNFHDTFFRISPRSESEFPQEVHSNFHEKLIQDSTGNSFKHQREIYLKLHGKLRREINPNSHEKYIRISTITFIRISTRYT